MSYVATKPVKFSKQYYIGDIVPADEILQQSEQRLIDLGLIAKVSNSETLSSEINETFPQEDNEQIVDDNKHAIDEISDISDDNNEYTTSLDDAKTIEDFMKFKKEQLIEYSKVIDLPVDSGMKKEEIAKALTLATN